MTPPHDAIREARILIAAKGSTVIPLIETFQQAGGQCVLVFPFMPYDLSTLLQQRTLHSVASGNVHTVRRGIICDVFKGLAHLHTLSILHRDIKPANILLATPDGPAYLADFGIAWSPTDAASEPSHQKILDVGTTSYRAPELLFGCSDYGPGLDLWAAGCVAAQILCDQLQSKPLFDAGDLGSELALIKSIFSTLGTPDDEGRAWPETRIPGRVPDWGKMRFQRFPTKAWTEVLPGVEFNALDLIRQLIVYESSARLAAAKVSLGCILRLSIIPTERWQHMLTVILLQVLKHPYLTN
jgi:cyclin-dependent kinase